MSLSTREKLELLEYKVAAARVAMNAYMDADTDQLKGRAIQLIHIALADIQEKIMRWKNEYPSA